MKFYYVTNILDLYTFDNETAALSKFFEISTEMHCVSLFFLNERFYNLIFDDTSKISCCALC